MTVNPALSDPDNWLQDIFAAQSVAKGHSIRRQVRDIERYAGWDRFVAEVSRRGYQAVRNRDHVVIFCNPDPIRRIV